MRKLTIFIVLTFLLVFCAAPAYASIPSLPHAFYGSVLINGAAAPNDTLVSATVENGTITPTQNPVATAGGNYGINSPKLLVQGDGLSGAITFYVNGVEAEGVTAVFEAGAGPTRRDLSVTVVAPAPPPPVGVAGVEVPPLPPGTTDVRGMISTGCRFYTSATANSEDRLCRLTIPTGTVGLTEELECLTQITMLIMDEPPPPPEDAHVIGLAYDFQPSGATFEPPTTLTFSYDPGDIPDGIAEEDLVIAYYDEDAGKWVELDCVVDTENNTITASISHFTAFTIIGAAPAPPPPPAPAAFSVTTLSIQPAEVQPKELVTITVSVLNTGGTEGSYSVVLKINGVKEAETSVTVAAGSSQSASFSATKEEAGSYSVDVDGLSGSFTVVAPVPAPPPPAPPAPPPAPPVPTPAPPAPPAPPSVWLFIVIGAIAAVVVVLVVYLVTRRRRY